jgi:hypothetical protein
MTAPLGEALDARDFLDIVSLDIVGPLPITERGNTYLLTFVDHFTRFCEAIPIATQDTGTIAREFVTKIIVQFGTSKKTLTDKGANFTCAFEINWERIPRRNKTLLLAMSNHVLLPF